MRIILLYTARKPNNDVELRPSAERPAAKGGERYARKKVHRLQKLTG